MALIFNTMMLELKLEASSLSHYSRWWSPIIVVSSASFVNEIFLRKEYQNKTYGLAAVYTSKVAFELPIMMMLGFILWIPFYFWSNLENDSAKFWLYIFTIMLLITYTAAFAIIIGTIFEDGEATLQLSAMFLGLVFLFWGFVQFLDQMYVWMRWTQYFTPTQVFSWNTYQKWVWEQFKVSSQLKCQIQLWFRHS